MNQKPESESCSSIHSLSVPPSVTSETKEKFDSLIKSALKKKQKQNKLNSRENLLESCSTSNEDLQFDKNGTNDNPLKYQEENKDYILNKFLGDSSSESFKKPPVPKPRKKKNSSLVKATEAKNENASESSEKTYVKGKLESPSSSSGNKTYNVEEIHHSPSIIEQKRNSTDTYKKKNTQDDKDEIIEIDTPKPAKRKTKFISEQKEELLSSTKSFSYEKIVEIIIHKTDRLLLNSMVVHPVVKIHIVDILTGKYFEKSDKNRPVVFFYENKNVDYMSPVMTHSFNLQEKRTLLPAWEETILLNEDYEYIVEESKNIIIFFEILDFVSFSTLQRASTRDCSKGWHNIAFAFLKLQGKNSVSNLHKKMRLQLYYSHQSKKNQSQTCQAWNWWKKKKLQKYPSTLYVTIKPVISPKKVTQCLRSKTPVQEEHGSSELAFENHAENGKILENLNVSTNSDDLKIKNLSQRLSEICKIPNKCFEKLDSYDEGCLVVKFSNNGRYLAAAVRCDDLFCIVIYSITDLKEITKFPCHQGLIYGIKWSQDDSLIVSASADNTVSIIDFKKLSFVQILPHPCFVYSCDINSENTIASGAFDGTIRIWESKSERKKIDFQLYQELERHKGYVTSICFSRKTAKSLFTADSLGVIIEWKKDLDKDWTYERDILILDLTRTVTVINQIALFPKEKKLMVSSRDSVIRVVDVKSGCVLQWLQGESAKKVQIFGSVSRCGNFVYCGSKCGRVNVWNSKNGHLVSTLDPFGVKKNHFFVVHCVEFHPFDDVLAVTHYGESLPILLYRHEKGVDVDSTENGNNLKHVVRIIEKVQHPQRDGEDVKVDYKSVLRKMDEVVVSVLQNNNK